MLGNTPERDDHAVLMRCAVGHTRRTRSHAEPLRGFGSPKRFILTNPLDRRTTCSRRVARQLDRDTKKLRCDWWETETASVIMDLARARAFHVVLCGLADVIRETGDPDWAAIAYDLGYSSQQHFITDFRKVVGMTPAAYKRAIQEP